MSSIWEEVQTLASTMFSLPFFLARNACLVVTNNFAKMLDTIASLLMASHVCSPLA
jgi:hypothetical protein